MPSPQDRSIIITHQFDADPEAVFQAWTDPQHLGWFFNPEQPVKTLPTVDLRVGGEWRQEMVIDAGNRYVTGGIYREIVPNRRLVFAWGAVDGWPELDPQNLDDALQATIELQPSAGGTRMECRLELPAHLSEEEVRKWFAMGICGGWTQTINRFTPALEPA